MTDSRGLETVRADDLRLLPGLAPVLDQRFLALADQALVGDLPVYFAAIPLSLIRPFDAAYDPAAHPVGEAAIRQVMAEWTAGSFTPAWVYPATGAYVVSDDYIVLDAARRGQPDFLPCWVLGEPTVPGPVDVQGPIAVRDVATQLGLRRD
jgi:hypothetical protein